jgi:hypothetical protein
MARVRDSSPEARARIAPSLITINPHFEQGVSVEALVADGSLHRDAARVFRVDGQSITLYRHCGHDRHRFGKVPLLLHTEIGVFVKGADGRYAIGPFP